MKTRLFPAFAALAMNTLLGACTLTSDEVEPALPALPVFGSSTVVYQLNDRPVVAHNGGGTLFSGIFGGNRYPPVNLFFSQPDSTLTVRSADEQNPRQPGGLTHALEWQLPRFRGVGRYRPVPAETSFQLYTQSSSTGFEEAGPRQELDPLLPAEVVVTSWDPLTARAQGTFELHFRARDGAPAAALRQGAFDVRGGY